jgi:hypothetical protein
LAMPMVMNEASRSILATGIINDDLIVALA